MFSVRLGCFNEMVRHTHAVSYLPDSNAKTPIKTDNFTLTNTEEKETKGECRNVLETNTRPRRRLTLETPAALV